MYLFIFFIKTIFIKFKVKCQQEVTQFVTRLKLSYLTF